MFAVGDRVVYPLHGGAMIKNIDISNKPNNRTSRNRNI